ncbi:hypothetical protein ACFW1M_01065 [Streptomyces inhibens]|uniref:hypothetical protein n=1 Tax=Streptomyces inhibens TaxID=2293571 RepID=UPI003674B7C0
MSANQYASWIDRGMPDPFLDEWARYLKWVMTKAQQEKAATLKIGEVSKITASRDEWTVTRNGTEPISGDALVITGPGDVTGVKGQLNGDRISDAKHFWVHPLLRRLQRHHNERVTVAVIGAGGAAASVILTLLRSMGDRCAIQVISPWGVVYTRGESYDENRHFTDPQHWIHLGEPNQRRFMDHTSQGVFSQYVKGVMNAAVNVETVAGWVLEVQENPSRVRMLMKDSAKEDCDYAIVATGFDDMWWAKPGLLDDDLIQEVQRCTYSAPLKPEFIRKHINYNLQLDQMSPPLHLPMLAGQSQGPGFPNLNCLGLLSDRILRPHCHIEKNGGP